MIQKAHEISLEAGSKMATAMKDVIFAAAGLTPFAAESAKDLVNYMVRRGQMGAEEAERIIRDIEAAAEKRGGGRPAPKAAGKDEPKHAAMPYTRPAFVSGPSPSMAPPPAPPAPPVAPVAPVAAAPHAPHTPHAPHAPHAPSAQHAPSAPTTPHAAHAAPAKAAPAKKPALKKPAVKKAAPAKKKAPKKK